MVKTDFFSLATEGVRSLQPYQPGKPLDELEREYGVSQAVKLASNENPLGPSPHALIALQSELNDLSRYPDGNGFALKTTLASHLNINTSQITLGNGSNDVLEFLARAFVSAGKEVIFSQHAFAVYPIVTQAVGGKAVVVPAKNWGHDLDAMRLAITDKTRLIFIANPNNPTGTWLTQSAVHDFIQQVPENVLVVLDEAYFEYASDPALGAEDYASALSLLSDFPNLVITRTFSKAYGLAGLRMGYGISSPVVADLLNRVRQPFNVNSLALAAAQAALADKEHLQKSVQVNVDGMQMLISAFKNRGLEFIPSVGNFVCVKVGRGAEVYEALLHEGVIVRPIANYEMPEYLRVTVGTADENSRFIEALKKVLKA
ncbi:MAG: histidinol-phosphate transaminase [Gammaproteobacteria bacterium]|nr:histidinol-phosphate transaminase [Gammaproteobacteria bacterium]